MIEAGKKKMPIFAARFSELRGDRTQAEFAEFLGISRPTVGFYENGERIPDALVLKQIAERCGVTTDYLVGLRDNKTKVNTDIGVETGLSDNAIELLRTANKQKKKSANMNSAKKYYPIDILSLLIENINYFPDLVLTISRELSIKEYHAEGIEAAKAVKVLEKKNSELFEKILKNGDVLIGAAYKEYLRNIIERNFGMLVRFISGKINPCEFDAFIRYEIEKRSTNTLTDRIKQQIQEAEEGTNHADDTETR